MGFRREVETPNITGGITTTNTWTQIVDNGASASGCFQINEIPNSLGATDSGVVGNCGFDIDASRQSSLYSGDSMQPKALTVLPCIRI